MQHLPLPPVDGRLHRSVFSLPAINPERLKTARALVEKAVKSRKVFSVQGPYPVIRAALWARGWVERRLPRPAQRVPRLHGNEDDDGDDDADITEGLEERQKDDDVDDMCDLMSRLVRNQTSYFYWTTRRDGVDHRSLRKDQMINHYANVGTFTTKVGLCVNLRNLHWFDTADPDTFFPRCYRLGAEDEKQAFIEDFRRTACSSLLQYIVENNNNTLDRHEVTAEEASVTGSTSHDRRRAIATAVIDRALQVCEDFLHSLEHGDIDVTMDTPPSMTEQQWAEFLHQYYLVVHEGVQIKGGVSGGVLVERCRTVLSRLKEACPQLDTDGLDNIWIIKPGALSRGRGIMCLNRLEEILRLVDSDPALIKDSKWVVQKYIERPLLVHGTKFDVRQWFLVTDWNPLTVWFYSECYLRFSTQPYSTKTMDSSVHLCNNSIQKHFTPSRQRHPGVPRDNMWSCGDFCAFLRRQGLGGAEEWAGVVVPGMRRAVVHALQTAQDAVEGRRASFELYGADFMLGRDLRPWLLEINASPTMGTSTAVTARLCPAVQLDTLRVVLDRPRADHPGARVGGFELIYKQAAVDIPQYMGVNLLVEGAPIRRCRPPSTSTFTTRPSITAQLSSDPLPSNQDTENKPENPSSHKVHAAMAEENHSEDGRVKNQSEDGGVKKRQLWSSTSPPERERERPTASQKTSFSTSSPPSLSSFAGSKPYHRLSSSEQQLRPHHATTGPQKKARRLVGLSLSGGGGGRGPPLVLRTLSYSLSPPYGASKSDSKTRTQLVSGGARSSRRNRLFLPKAATMDRPPQRRRSLLPPQGFIPSPFGPLPALEVISLRPPIPAATQDGLACHGPLHRHRLFFPHFPHRGQQTLAEQKCDGGSTEHKRS